MKNTLSVFFVFMAVLFCAPVLKAEDNPARPEPGVVQSATDTSLPKPGIVTLPGYAVPDAKFQPADSVPIQSQAQTAGSVTEDPQARKKEQAQPKEEKKSDDKKKDKSARKAEKERKKQEQAIQKAMDDAVNAQVKILRDERQKKMPYLDRMYIRTSITPLKVHQKEEFLQGGEKDLGDLIYRAKTVHTQAKASYEAINLYHRRVLYALRKLFPEISFNFNDRTGLLSGEPFRGNDWRISLRQPIFQGGILWNTFLQEKTSLEAAKKQYDKVISDLIYDLSRAYFEYQRTDRTMEEHKAAVAQMKRFYDMSQEKFNQKLIAEIEALNVQSLYSQMQFDLETAKQEFEIAKLELQKFLDLSEEDSVVLKRTYDLAGLVVKNPETDKIASKKVEDLENVARFLGDEKAPHLPQIIDMSYGNRPELMVESAKLQATRLAERIRWGEFLPKVFLTYEAGELGEAYTQASESMVGAGYKNHPDLKKEWRLLLEMTWNVGGSKVNYTYDRDSKAPSISQYLAEGGTKMRKNGLNMGVLDGLDAYVNVKQAEVDKLNQIVELEKAEKQVLQDVKQAFYDYQKSLIQVRSTAKRVKWRERLESLAEHRLGRKEVEISEFMQAVSDLVREKGDLHKALKDYYSAKAAVNHAIGVQNYLGIEGDHGTR